MNEDLYPTVGLRHSDTEPPPNAEIHNWVSDDARAQAGLPRIEVKTLNRPDFDKAGLVDFDRHVAARASTPDMDRENHDG